MSVKKCLACVATFNFITLHLTFKINLNINVSALQFWFYLFYKRKNSIVVSERVFIYSNTCSHL